MTDTRNRTNAITALQATQDAINRIPQGEIPTSVVMAGSQSAAVFALAAVAHALLDVADAIRETGQEGTP